MRIRKISLLTLCLVFLLTALPSSQLSAQDNSASDAPYIYYYSDWLNAFVIERADGSDSRLFGQGVITAEANNVSGAWSPSGEWFFVRTSHYTGDVYRQRKYYLFNINGTGYPTLLSTFEDINSIRWDEENDVLKFSVLQYINYEIDGQSRSAHQTENYALDVTTNQLERTISYQTETELFIPTYNSTLADGTTIFYHLDNHLVQYVLRVTRPDGKVSQRYIQPSENLDDPVNLSKAGWLIYYDVERDTTVLLNALTEQQIDVAISKLKRGSVRWYNNGETAFIYAPSGSDSEITRLWHIDIRDNQVDLRQFPIQGEIKRIFEEENYAIFDIDNYLYWINLTDFSHIPIAFVGDGSWYFDDTLDYIVVLDDNYCCILHSIAIFDIHTQTTQVISLEDIYRHETSSLSKPYFSSDKRYLGIVLDGAVIYDTTTEKTHRFSPHSGGAGSNWGGHIRWHNDSNWMFIYDDSSMTNSDGTYWVSVGNIETEVFRELSVNRYKVDWLPEQFDVKQLSAGQPTSYFPSFSPASRIFTGEWIRELQWSTDVFNIKANETIYPQTHLSVEKLRTIEFIERPSLYNNIVAESPDGSLIVERLFDRETQISTIQVRTKSTNEIVADIPALAYQEYTVSPDNRLLVGQSRSYSPRFYVWDIETEELLLEIPLAVTAVDFTPDGSQIALGVGWEIWIWDVDHLLKLGD